MGYVVYPGQLSPERSRYSFPSGTHGSQVYNVAGSYTWTVPAGVSLITVYGVGAGGGGGQAFSAATSAPNQLSGGTGGGGASGSEATVTIAVTPGDTITVTVGAGGAGGSGLPFGIVSGGDGGSTFVKKNGVDLVDFGQGVGGVGYDMFGSGNGSGGSPSASTVHAGATLVSSATGNVGQGNGFTGGGASVDVVGTAGFGGDGGASDPTIDNPGSPGGDGYVSITW
jgi:hypothetical protein